MDDELYFLSETSLDAHEWRGVQELAKALNDLEPLAKRARLGEVVAERLVSLGLAEKGRSSSPARRFDGKRTNSGCRSDMR